VNNESSDFALAVQRGLAKLNGKSLPCKFIYDAQGSKIFEEIIATVLGSAALTSFGRRDEATEALGRRSCRNPSPGLTYPGWRCAADAEVLALGLAATADRHRRNRRPLRRAMVMAITSMLMPRLYAIRSLRIICSLPCAIQVIRKSQFAYNLVGR
jgi:hypothetical protein